MPVVLFVVLLVIGIALFIFLKVARGSQRLGAVFGILAVAVLLAVDFQAVVASLAVHR